eukprot:Hpha_TRINITY_DN6797_c0_g1::TRINITY_DN6797_c0_g1_i2::g.110964::m.110964
MGTNWSSPVEGCRWEEALPVRVVWLESHREYQPSALKSTPASEMMRATEGVWTPRLGKRLEIVVRPLVGGLCAVRVILPAASERWGRQMLFGEFATSRWHAPLADGAVLPAEILPVLVRSACLTASRAFREQGGEKGPTYASPQVTRGLMLHKLCSSLPNTTGSLPPHSPDAGAGLAQTWSKWRQGNKCIATDLASLFR